MTTFIPSPELLLSPRGRSMEGVSPGDLDASGEALPHSCDTFIIGAGLAGIAIATHLWHAGRRDFVLVDPHDRVCAQFFHRVDTLVQAVLRSPYEHHPGAEGFADCELVDFARFNWHQLTTRERTEIRMAQSGQRSVVPLDVFRGFCARVARMHALSSATVRATVTGLDADGDGILVTTTAGQVRARQVVAATGEQAIRAPRAWEVPPGGPIRYWDDDTPFPARDHVAVVGSGLSSAHLVAHHLHCQRQVTWVQRGRERFQCADVDASFFRPEGRFRYLACGRSGREALVRQQRRPSIMHEFAPGLREAEAAGRLTVLREQGQLKIRLTADDCGQIRTEAGRSVTAPQVILALGTRPVSLPSLRLSDGRALGPEEVRVDDSSLRVKHMGRLYVTGALATPALGPAARNIDGHRVASQLISADITAAA